MNTTSPAQTVKVTNTGTAALTFSYIQMQGLNTNDFNQANNCPTSLATGASCTVTVTFTPTTTSTRSGSLTFIDNAADSAEQVVLSGTGVAANPGVSLNPLNIDFGNQNNGTTSAVKTATLTNASATALAISSIAITGTDAGAFAQTNTCPSSLATNASCTISVTFTPPQSAESDIRTASVTITDNGNASPQAITLSGTGVSPSAGAQLSVNQLNLATRTMAQRVMHRQ